MKNAKKLLALLLALVLVVGVFTACGGSKEEAPAEPAAEAPEAEKEEEKPAEKPATSDIKVGVVMPAATHGFTGESIKHAEAEIKKQAEERGFEYKFLTAEEASGQVTHVETLLTWEPDVIVLWPIEGDSLRSAAENILDNDVQLIIYDRLIENFVPTAEIMGDNDAIGEMAGKYFSEFFADDIAAGEKIQYLEFMGDNSTVPKQRSDGFKKTIDPAFELAAQPFSTDWQRQVAMEQMESWLNSSTKEEVEALDAIFTHDDEVAIGILDAMKNYTGDAKISVRLMSGVSAGKDYISTFEDPGVEGLSQVAYTFSPSMVRNAIQLGVAAAYGEQYDGKAIEGMFLIPTDEIDLTNLEEYMNSDLYKERYSVQ